MRRIINSTNVSLDGLIEAMERWHYAYIDEELSALVAEQLADVDALLLGRRTYEGWAETWPAETGPIADKLNGMTKYVASTTLDKADWTNTSIIDSNLADQVRKIKQQPGQNILTYGIGPVVKELLKHDLLDEIHLSVHPILAGTGNLSEMLFTEGLASKFELLNTRALTSGVVVLSYRPVPH
ncbi:dihydrofolate reductase family protein [Nonomuraea sp. NPDC059023]|uniref:dihydrofolate reductase family protein n=1 Tax=unclassified Nonomuraea TaxID=2593643 RepID=UPI0036CFCB0F